MTFSFGVWRRFTRGDLVIVAASSSAAAVLSVAMRESNVLVSLMVGIVTFMLIAGLLLRLRAREQHRHDHLMATVRRLEHRQTRTVQPPGGAPGDVG